MASLIYGSLVRDILTGAVDFDTDTFYGMLVGSTYDAIADETKRDTHAKRSDITDEISGTNYTAGGTEITVTVGTYDTSNNYLDVTFGAISWANSTISNAYGLVVYKRRGGASSADELVFYNDFGAAFSSTADAFNVAASTVRVAL